MKPSLRILSLGVIVLLHFDQVPALSLFRRTPPNTHTASGTHFVRQTHAEFQAGKLNAVNLNSNVNDNTVKLNELNLKESAPESASASTSTSRATNSNSASELNFLVLGDWGSPDEEAKWTVAKTMEQVAVETDAKFVVSVGDNYYFGKDVRDGTD
ncbi:hypothetical protein HK102_005988, partial [Quaeritorhiza haematococci]